MKRWPLIMGVLGCCLLAACAPSWTPEEKTKVYKSSYSLTKDGHYRVRRGDTLHAIAFNFGMDWRDIASWNSILPPYLIYPDQELRLSPPQRKSAGHQVGGPAAQAPEATSGDRRADAAPDGTVIRAAPAKSATTVTVDNSPDTGQIHASAADPGKWLWPTEGRIISNFKAGDPTRNGIEVGGKEGQAIRATASGEVVYSGNGLIGYGELIIIKHSDRMLSAYAHNRKRLVLEGRRVTAGEHIAEMGRNERNQPLLHFEIRRNGTPQDPLEFLDRR